jgi:hypothetical protein
VPDGPDGRFLVTRIEDGAARRIEARAFSPLIGGAVVASTPAKSGTGTAAAIFAPLVELMDLPQFESGNAADFARGAVYARPWRSTVLSSSPSTQAYARRVLLDRPAQIATLLTPLSPGVSGRFDWSQPLDLDLPYGGLESAPKLSVLNGANRYSMQSQSGAWEIGAFVEAEETAPGRWRLSGLLRGLSGTEDAMTAGIAAGAAFVMLDDAVKPLALTGNEMGLQLNWIAEAAGSSEISGPIPFEGGMRAQTPLSPVHIRGRRNADGAVAITWLRRGRIDADNWIPSDIPLDEPTERYRVDLMQAGLLKRRVEVGAAGWTYAAVDEIADFGGPQSQLDVIISQMGQWVPSGIPASAVIAL